MIAEGRFIPNAMRLKLMKRGAEGVENEENLRALRDPQGASQELGSLFCSRRLKNCRGKI